MSPRERWVLSETLNEQQIDDLIRLARRTARKHAPAHVVDDIAIETLMLLNTAFLRNGPFEFASGLVVMIARNVAQSWIRSESRRDARELRAASPGAGETESFTLLAEAILKEGERLGFSEQDQFMLALRLFYGLTVLEIAEILEHDHESVKGRLRLLFSKLRRSRNIAELVR